MLVAAPVLYGKMVLKISEAMNIVFLKQRSAQFDHHPHKFCATNVKF